MRVRRSQHLAFLSPCVIAVGPWSWHSNQEVFAVSSFFPFSRRRFRGHERGARATHTASLPRSVSSASVTWVTLGHKWWYFSWITFPLIQCSISVPAPLPFSLPLVAVVLRPSGCCLVSVCVEFHFADSYFSTLDTIGLAISPSLRVHPHHRNFPLVQWPVALVEDTRRSRLSHLQIRLCHSHSHVWPERGAKFFASFLFLHSISITYLFLLPYSLSLSLSPVYASPRLKGPSGANPVTKREGQERKDEEKKSLASLSPFLFFSLFIGLALLPAQKRPGRRVEWGKERARERKRGPKRKGTTCKGKSD